MPNLAGARVLPLPWSVARIIVGVALVAILIHAFLLGGDRNGINPFDYFGYFTNLTCLLTAGSLIVAGIRGVANRRPPDWLTSVRAVLTTCMVIVGVIYNTLVPGTGTAPAWVSATLHIAAPLLVVLDWILSGDRQALPWSRLWIVLPYPSVWLIVVLVRGATDGWVPYGFLLPSRGILPLVAHIGGLLAALVLTGALVWWSSRLPGLARRRRGGNTVPVHDRRSRLWLIKGRP